MTSPINLDRFSGSPDCTEFVTISIVQDTTAGPDDDEDELVPDSYSIADDGGRFDDAEQLTLTAARILAHERRDAYETAGQVVKIRDWT